MNDMWKEILNVCENLDAKGKAAVLRRARRLLARQKKNCRLLRSGNPSSARDHALKQPKGILAYYVFVTLQISNCCRTNERTRKY